jgi:regulator of sigma E protease
VGLYLIAASSTLQWWIEPGNWLSMLLVAIGLGTVIFVHELGHFLVAKACGVKCEKFYVGFDFFDIKLFGYVIVPRSLVKFKWGETEYGIGNIPLGGYVKMLGQDDNPAPSKQAEEMERIKVRKEGGAEQDEQSFELDPRSYQAKAVWKRMLIISAGVVMNLIFAVIFATIAFRLGVANTPCVVGGTIPGGPAWEAGLEPGDKIVQIGRDGKRREHLRFRDDLVNAVVLNGDDQDLDLLVRRADGKEVWLAVRPRNDPTMGFATIGLSPAASTRLNAKPPTVERLPAAMAKPDFKGGDVIVAVGGESLGDTEELRYAKLKSMLLLRADETLTLTVQRAGDSEGQKQQQVDIVVDPNPARELGIAMTMGKITAIQKDSPADKAGIKVGDVISQVNGGPVGDPMTLPDRLRRLVGQSVEVEVAREGKQAGSKESRLLTVVPQVPTSTVGQVQDAAPMSSEELGIAYEVLNRVQAVQPNSPAANQGVRAGDEIVKVEFVAAGKEQKEIEEERLRYSNKPIELDDEHLNWPLINTRLQMSLPDTKLKITLKRGKEVQTVELQSVASTEYFNPNRGLMLSSLDQEFHAESWGDALALGGRQTLEDALKIVVFLKKLVTGKLSVKGLGGPGTIAVVATAEASESPTRLLMFLTLLSANLAVVNFLPIPVLDGGHMIFLMWEGIRGKPPSEKWQIGLTLAGFAFVLSLMLFVIGLDVVRLSGLGG